MQVMDLFGRVQYFKFKGDDLKQCLSGDFRDGTSFECSFLASICGWAIVVRRKIGVRLLMSLQMCPGCLQSS